MSDSAQWRRGDSNPKRSETEPLQERDNSATERSEKPLEDESRKQSHDTFEQLRTLPQHKLGAHLVRAGGDDQDLAKIAKVWSQLPEHIKAAIKALIQTHEAMNRTDVE